jgi:hypothetical protein
MWRGDYIRCVGKEQKLLAQGLFSRWRGFFLQNGVKVGISMAVLAAYPSGLRGRFAKPLFVGSNPTAAFF